VGSTGPIVVELLRKKNVPVRALVFRDDERAESLRKLGAEIVVGDMTNIDDAERVVKGVRSIYFAMSVASGFLEASITMTTAARKLGVEIFVNLSQAAMANYEKAKFSPQARAHWLAERALEWSGVPHVNLWAGLFWENPFLTILTKDSVVKNGILQTPFAPEGNLYPISAHDVSRIAVNILLDPAPHVGKSYIMIGPKITLDETARALGDAIGRPVKSESVPSELFWNNERATLLRDAHAVGHLKHLGTLVGTSKGYEFGGTVRATEALAGGPLETAAEWFKKHADFYKA